jgi:outer membrane protein
MKKTILVAIALFAFGFANAQTEEGTWTIGGSTSLGFSSSSSKLKSGVGGDSFDGPKVTNFNIKPSVGYFVVENLQLGLALGYDTKKVTSKSIFDSRTSKATQNQFSLIPQATYYFGKSNVKPFLNAGVGYGSLSGSDEATTSDGFITEEYSSSGLAWGINGGVSYFVGKSVSFDLSLGYQSLNLSDKDNNKTTTSSFVSNVGVSVYF